MVKYSEKLFLSMYEGLKAKNQTPDICVCGSDLIVQDILNTLYKHGISMHVICDNEISAKSFILTTESALGMMPGGGAN